MKLKESMNQAVTKVNVSGLEIYLMMEVDAAHICGRPHCFSRKWLERNNSIGVLGDGMVQDGLFVNLGDLHSSAFNKEQYVETSLKGQGSAKGYTEVGLGGSTRSEIRTRTWGSAQQINTRFNTSSVNPLKVIK